VAYAVLAEGRDSDGLEELDAKIGMIEDPEQAAMEMLRRHQEEMGLAPSEQTPAWDGADEEWRLWMTCWRR
jgi:hypothetical protein